MTCVSMIIVLSATSIVLGWLVHHQSKAMGAQRTALKATKATVDALKTQSDLRIEPLKDTINAKDGAIQALEAQLSAATERKALAEERLRAHQEQLNRVIAELPSELRQVVQAEVDKERTFILRTAGSLFLNFGYYLGILNLGALALQIQSLTFARLEKEKVSGMEYAVRAGVEYLKNSVLFFHRERRIAIERCTELTRAPGVRIPDSILDELQQLADADKMVRDSGLVMDPEVEELSALKDVPFNAALFDVFDRVSDASRI